METFTAINTFDHVDKVVRAKTPVNEQLIENVGLNTVPVATANKHKKVWFMPA